MISGSILNKVKKEITPILKNEGLELYHIEYARENNENYLRVYIEKDGGVTISDCITASKTISGEYLDIHDPIKDAYVLEVSSPGIERDLHTDEHINKYLGSQVTVNLTSLHLGKKKVEGELKDNNENEVVIVGEDTWAIPKEKIKRIKIKGEF